MQDDKPATSFSAGCAAPRLAREWRWTSVTDLPNTTIGPEPSPEATKLAETIMRRIKKGLDASGLNIDPQFTGLAQLIELYLMAAREEGRAGR